MQNILKSRSLLPIFILVLLSLFHLIFAFRTNNYFSVDDFAVLAYFKSHSILEMTKIFISEGDIFGFRKIIGYIVFGFLYKTVGVNPDYYNVTLFLFHSFNLVFIYLISKELTRKVLPAFFISVIFNKYYLFYFSNIHEYCVTLFSLLTIFLFLKFPKKVFMAYIAYFFAILSKEAAFSVPLVLLSISFFKNLNRRNIYPMLLLSITYYTYQSYEFLFARSRNESYMVSLNIESILNGIIFYFDKWLLTLCIVLIILNKRYKYLPLFFVAILTIIPASILSNRRELYYAYLSTTYLLMYLSLNLPKLSLRSCALYVLVFFIFGGRSLLPKVAWQDFPNWQKDSINKVLDKAQAGENDFSGIILERDAKLMIESGTVDIFLKERNDNDQF